MRIITPDPDRDNEDARPPVKFHPNRAAERSRNGTRQSERKPDTNYRIACIGFSNEDETHHLENVLDRAFATILAKANTTVRVSPCYPASCQPCTAGRATMKSSLV